MRLRIAVNPRGEVQLSWGLFDAPPGLRRLLAAFPWIFYFAWGYGVWRVGGNFWHELARGLSGEHAGWFWGGAVAQLVWLVLWLTAGFLASRLLGVVPRLAQPSTITLAADILRYEPGVESDFSPEAAKRGEPMPRLPFRVGRPRALARSEVRELEIMTVDGAPQLALYAGDENFFVGVGLEEADVRRLDRALRRWLAGTAP